MVRNGTADHKAGADAVGPEHLRPDPRQRDLADRGRGLAIFQLQRSARQLEPAAAKRDRARGDDEDVAALAMQPGHVVGEGRQPRRPHLAPIGIDQQRRADLDDDAAELTELRAGHGACYDWLGNG